MAYSEINISAQMEENENPTMLAFDAPKELPTFIKVIGVGGGGGNAVNHMFRQGIQGVDFIVCNTDTQALQSSPVPNKIAIGKGLGAGGKAERAKAAALEKADEIKEVLSHNTQMLFITAGMGGGTGTGAAPVIAEIAKSIELEDADTTRILVVAIVTMPFSFEGRRRREQAEAGIAELRKHVDSILVINNDKLRSFGDMTINNAFSKADDVLLTAAKGIAEIITVTSYVNVDFQDVNTVMENSGTALMGAGIGKGENRAMEAIKAASSSVLLNDDNIAGAKYVLLYFACNPEHMIRMDEVDTVTTYLSELTGPDSEEVIWGMGASDDLDDEIKITLIATGFEKNKTQLPLTESYQPPVVAGIVDKPVVNEPIIASTPNPVKPITEPTIIQKAEPTSSIQPSNHHNEDFEQGYTAIIDKTSTFENNENVGHKYVLDQSELIQAEVEVEDIHSNNNEDSSDGIYLKTKDLDSLENSTVPFTPKVEQPKMVETKIETPTLNDNDALSRAERIKHMYDLLHNNPNGPAIVEESMRYTPNEDAFASSKSDSSDANSSTMDANGSIFSKNSFLFEQPD